MFRALIIEDNAPAREGLKARLKAHPKIAIIGEAGAVGRARTLLALDDYDLVFLDIQLRGGSGFDLVSHTRPAARVIFSTSFDHYAVRAFEVNAVDYLLKPITPERLKAALARLDISPAEPTTELSPDDLIHLRTDTGSQFVAVSSIKVIQSELNYTLVHLHSAPKQLVRRALKEWEAQLPATEFMRVSREAIVNLHHIERAERNEQKSGRLWLTGMSAPVDVSRRHWVEVRTRFERI